MRTLFAAILCLAPCTLAAADLAAEFRNPPQEARPRVYWTWLHAYDKARITHELEEMKKKGIGGFIHWESGAGPSRYGTRAVAYPREASWMDEKWRDHLRHAFNEADRLGLDVSLALTPGANCGGPWITAADSAQKLVIGTTSVIGPVRYSEVLPMPDGVPRDADGKPLFYRDLAVFGAETYRLGHSRWQVEGAQFYPTVNADNDPIGNPWIDITAKMDASGRLTWDVPPGVFRILRIGHTTTGQKADYSGGPSGGYYADHMRKEPIELNFVTMFSQLFGNGALPRSLKFVHCDSYEVYNSDWTPSLLDEFRKRRGYDPAPYLPTLDGGNVESRALTARFRADLNKTRSDLFNDYHFQLLADLAHARGVGLQSEAAGPRINAMDALRVLGRNDLPMGEFWLEANTHRVTEDERFYLKHVASAAHVYGKQFVAAEAFTSIGGHWEEDPWSLKRAGDQAFLEGANRFFLHTFSHSPGRFGKPGIEYFAGSHLNANNTWWNQSGAWLDYLARCQYLLSRGLFVADVAFYLGDQVPNWTPRRHVNPSLGPGYEYDAVNAEVILERMSVRDGRLVLPDGMSYRVLALPEWKASDVAVLRKIGELIKAGATVVGAPPSESSTLAGYPRQDEEVAALVREIWGNCDGKTVKERRHGQGRIVWGKTLREVLTQSGVAPDFEPGAAAIDAIHRSTPEAEIYFVVNKSDTPQTADCVFRTAGKAPEFWDPVTGTSRAEAAYSIRSGRTVLSVRLAPRGSVFVVFRGAANPRAITSVTRDGARATVELSAGNGGAVTLRTATPGRYVLRNAQSGTAVLDVAAAPAPVAVPGPWNVTFTPGWGAPPSAVFPELVSWTTRPEDGIKYYSGTAAYETTFDVSEALLKPGIHLSLDLGELLNLAEVRLNGQDLGTFWKRPFIVDGIASHLRPQGNRLEVRVTNLWVNRLIGDEVHAGEKRYTNTNMFKFTKDSPLRPSGLLGPVRIVAEREQLVKWAAGR